VLAIAERRTSAPKFLINDPLVGTRRFTVEEYHELGDAGILTPESRVELIDGWIVEKPVQKRPHARCLAKLQKLLPRVVPASFEFQSQLPITLTTSEPEPDVVVMRGPAERYDDVNPGPRDLALVIGVSHTSLAIDQGPKYILYAAARVPVYWIINIVDAQIEVYTDPRGGKTPAFRTRTDYRRGTSVPVVLNGRIVTEIAVNDLLK
jgi:Uma2 family endonuclease